MQFNYLVKCMICELAKITLLGVDQMVVIGILSLLLNYFFSYILPFVLINFKKIIIYFVVVYFITKENLIMTYNFAYLSWYFE
jgi:hypothetical protein